LETEIKTEKDNSDQYEDFDLDILSVAYSVHVIVKGGPSLPEHIIRILEKDETTEEEDDEARKVVTEMIEAHVKNKVYLYNTMDEAQRKRRFNQKYGIAWYTWKKVPRKDVF